VRSSELDAVGIGEAGAVNRVRPVRSDRPDPAGPETADDLPTVAELAAGCWPGVSAVLPVLDEARHLGAAVAAVLAQDYPGPLEIVLALGPSRDGTDELAAELAATDPRIRTVPNPAGSTPAALNAAIAASSHPVVVRVDGHATLAAGYIRRAVELLVETGADNVGGIMDAAGDTAFETAVARAMTSRWGIGGAVFHTGGAGGPADSVYLGVFRRAALVRVGGFDEHYRRAQDWELNLRLRRSGGTVWFSPDLRVGYRPRSSWAALATQFAGSGRWRREIVRRHPETAGLRYLAPPVVTAAVLAGAVSGVGGSVLGSVGAHRIARLARLGWLAPLGYGVGVVAAAAAESRDLPAAARIRLPAIFAVMHLSWGWGFLRGVRGGR
jgi:succinoglycan biosynthesis protein ExoA